MTKEEMLQERWAKFSETAQKTRGIYEPEQEPEPPRPAPLPLPPPREPERYRNPERYKQKRAYALKQLKLGRIARDSTFSKMYIIGADIPLEEIDAQEAVQDHRCAICRDTRGQRRLHVDHDHATGEFRGMLCHRCNQGLGQFRDNPALLLEAITYLADPPARRMPGK